MLFMIYCVDKPGSLDLRLQTRPTHLAYLREHMAAIVQGGPLLDAVGKPAGSLLLVEFEHEDAARAFAAGDPYAKAGLFASSLVQPFRGVFKDGRELG